MTPDGESPERAFELDLLIEARRAGELTGVEVPAWALPLMELAADLGSKGREQTLPDADVVWLRVARDVTAEREADVARRLEALALPDVPSGLDELRREGVLPDEDLVWSRVSAGMSGRGVVERESDAVPWWRVGPFGRRPMLWGPVGAAAAVVIAIVLMLAQPAVNTAEAFVRDVEELSALADAALADSVLTEQEKDSVAELAIELRLTIDRRPETLIELDAQTRESVLATLVHVTEQLTPIADEELVALRNEAPVPATVVEPVDGGGSGTPAATATQQSAGTVAVATPEPDRIGSGRGSDSRSDSARTDPPAGGHVSPLVASSVTSLHEVADAVEGAGEAGDRSSGAGLATPGYLLGLCRDLRGQERSGCQRAINAAIAACSGAADRDELDDCADASGFAGEVCQMLLPAEEAGRCVEALDGLGGGEALGEWDSGSGDRGGKSTDEDDDDADRERDRDRKDRDGDD